MSRVWNSTWFQVALAAVSAMYTIIKLFQGIGA
jgi:hypothetical protein